MTEIFIDVPGLRDFRTELRKLAAELPKELTKANKEFASRTVPKVQSAYDRLYPKSNPKNKRRRDPSGKTRAGIRARASQTSAGIAIGGARLPHMRGLEFGSERFAQFRPWTGKGPGGRGAAGRFLYPTVRENVPQLMTEYGEVIDKLAKSAFPSANRV